MLSKHPLISYFWECYRSDNRTTVLLDFSSKKVEDQLYIELKEELINGQIPYISIPYQHAVQISKTMQLFAKEKEFIYASFFIGGYVLDAQGKKVKIFAPLFYYPAKLEFVEEEAFLSINAQERQLNLPLLKSLIDEKINDFLEDPIYLDLPVDFLPFEALSGLRQLLKKHLPELDSSALLTYPNLESYDWAKKRLRQLTRRKNPSTSLLAVSAIAVLKKSYDTRGVLNELERLATTAQLSPPLKVLLDPHFNAPVSPSPEQLSALPMILNQAQQDLVASAASNTLTMIVGPPGTGKTFTIGAIAIEHMIRGKSVLIASRTNEAVDVIKNKISQQLENEHATVRGGRQRSYATALRRHIKALITKKRLIPYLVKSLGLQFSNKSQSLSERLKESENSIKKRRKVIAQLIKKMEKEIDLELHRGAVLAQKDASFGSKVKTLYWQIKQKISTPLWEYSEQFNTIETQQIDAINTFIKLNYIHQVNQAVQNHWQDLKSFYEAMKLASDTQRAKIFESINFENIFKAFPIWLTKISEIKNVLPFQREMVDLLIIDEATQCDIASCLPLIQRAKKVVFAGDPEQLRHISFLSDSLQNIYKHKYQLQQLPSTILNYRRYSILDFVIRALKDGSQISTLNEHYRSIPPIIAFSNKHFYDDDLKIMTARPDDDTPGLYWIQCQGKRIKDGTNPKEADKLIDTIAAIIKEEQQLSDTTCSSLGILSPFRAQVELLSALVVQQFSLEQIQKHHLSVGTAYSFQGEERDLMFLSFALDKDSHSAAFRHLNKADVFNVSITRARKGQYLFCSLTANQLPIDALLRAYLSFKPKQQSIKKNKFSDTFLIEIITLLKSWNIQHYWKGYHLAGTLIELLIKKNMHYIAIDLIGYPGMFSEAYGTERYRVLHRAGINTFPIAYSDWCFDRATVEEQLKTYLDTFH